MSTLSIGQLAREAEVAVDTIRYYERIGLLAPAARLASGYRRYDTAALRRLRFIRRAKALGFALETIAELLALSEQADIAAVRRTAEQQLVDVERRICELQQLRAALQGLVRECPGHGAPDDCPILNALSGDQPT